MEKLKSSLSRIDAKGYKAYKDLKGSYNFKGYVLTIDHVQGDPFATPSRISIKVPAKRAGIPEGLTSNKIRKTALEDYLGRCLARSINAIVKGRRGIGKSGEVVVETSGQQVLVRNAVLLGEDGLEARLTIGLPAAGRTIVAREAEAIFFEELPKVVSQSLFFSNMNADKAISHVESVEDQEYLRSWLNENRLVAFVADGSLLPRRSGIDDRPLDKDALTFKSPENNLFSVDLPNAGCIKGMGIQAGVTLIVGGGFHGKSTLLHALERGVYNHIPGDGREKVATVPDAVKVRAEDGRSIWGVDISPFIDNLPFGRDTVSFSTENGSGSTSQAANIIEALECGAKLLLIDEDTSATNFMIRDHRMQSLVVKEKEPITPLLHRVRELYDVYGVSTVIVMGGSGDYFGVSDHVIMMDSYEPEDVTEKAHSLTEGKGMFDKITGLPPFVKRNDRKVEKARLNPRRGNRDVKINVVDVETLLFGENRIDLSGVEQLIDMGQTKAIGLLMHYYAKNYLDKTTSLVDGLKLALEDVENKGLDIISPYKVGDLALPRLHELAAAVNRIRDKV